MNIINKMMLLLHTTQKELYKMFMQLTMIRIKSFVRRFHNLFFHIHKVCIGSK